MYAPKTITASRAITASDAGTPLVLSAAAGLTATLPATAGTGRKYEFIIGTTITSNNYIIAVANATDVMEGSAILAQDAGDTAVVFETASTSDTITMNGTTKGGIKGDRIVLTDYATGFWHVQMIGSATGTEATPFSAAVS